jgi:hypothetical protein
VAKKKRAKPGRPIKLGNAKLRNKFLRFLRRGVPFATCCKACRIAPNTVYSYRDNNPEFAADLEQADAECDIAAIEAWLAHRATDPKTARQFVGIRVAEYREAREPQTNVNVNIATDPNAVRGEVIGILDALCERARTAAIEGTTEQSGSRDQAQSDDGREPGDKNAGDICGLSV